MASTTNYNWSTPDDTALVKDGAAAIRTLGSSVDTTTKALNPSTTLGDLEYRSATANTNTRLGIGSTGQVLTVAGGVPTWATAGGGDDGPAIGVKRSANQTISASTWTVVQFNTEDFDTNSNFNTGTYRFTPTTAGYYQVNLSIAGSGSNNQAMIAKNGNFVALGTSAVSVTSSISVGMVYMNGSTDYIEGQVFSSGTTIYSDNYTTYMSAAMVRKA
jgi:hypothetical protein